MFNPIFDKQSSDSQLDFEGMINTPDLESIFGANTTETLSQDDSGNVYATASGDSGMNMFQDVSSSSYDEASSCTLPEFVRYFTSSSLSPTSHGMLYSSRDAFRSMLSTLEKPQLIEILSQSIVESPSVADKVRSCVSKLTVFRRLLVRNISFQSTSEEVKSFLASRYGPIEEGTVVYDRISGRSKGFAFMTFVSVESACDAIQDSMAGLIELNGRQVLLKFAADREDTTANEGVLAAAPLSPGSLVPRQTALHRQSSNMAAAPRKLFVYNLSPLTTSESLASVFGEYGPMEECFVVADQAGMSKRYAFVTFYNEDSTWRCLEEPSKLVDGQMTFTHLASEGPSSSKHRNIRRPSPPQIDNLSPLADLLNGLMLSAASCK